MQWPTIQTLVNAAVVSLAILLPGAATANGALTPEALTPEAVKPEAVTPEAVTPEAVLGPQASLPVMVEDVVDAVTLRLGDGRAVRLGNVRAPEGPGRVATETALRALAAGQTVRLYRASQIADRHGRITAQVVVESAVGAHRWIQADLAAAGLVYAFPDDHTMPQVAAQLLTLEAGARSAGRGLWGSSANYILAGSDPGTITDGFHLVEGKVLAIGESRHSLFLNFGADYRSDFTIVVQRSDRDGFAKGLRDVRALQGRHIRVRGYVFRRGGPAIRAMHQQVIEILE
jgi:micrococcal nuclease